jgi:phosphoenolpyruvate synthase/pyruvate phosphate dikinase
MDFIKEFGQLGKHDAAIAGGKGASLGEMTQAGIPVPPGFVILSGAFEHFLEETGLHAEIDATLHTVSPSEMHTVEHASEKIQALILGAKMPEDIATEIQKLFAKLDAEYVAVRSSATAEDSASAAWAGQLDSFLNTTDDTLLTNVQRCWASLFTPRAIFYRFEKELHTQKISVAVVVQKMVQSEVSGIAFSVHPVTEDYNQLIIEAGFGLGEAIVSGSVTPDSYVVEKEPRRIIDKNVTYQSRALWRAENGGNEWRALSETEGTKPALSDEQALELSEIILRIERHYGFPCDIEWAYEAGTFFITQSRPITTLAPLAVKDEAEFISPELARFPRQDYEFVGRWKSDLFTGYFWNYWFRKEMLKKLDFSVPFSGSLGLKGGNTFYHKQVVQWGSDEMQRMLADHLETRSKRFRDSAEKDFAELLKKADSFAESMPDQNNFKQVVDAYQDFMLYFLTANLISPHFDPLIAEKAVEEGVPAEDVVSLIPKFPAQIETQHADARRLLGLLKKKSLDALLGVDTEKLVIAINTDKELKGEFEKHLKEFGWLELLNFIGAPLSLERLLGQLKTASGAEQAHEHAAHAYKLSDEFKHLLKTAADIGFVRQAAAETSSIFHYKLISYLEKTAQALGLTYREMLNLVPPEIVQGLSGAKSHEELKRTAEKRAGYNWLVYGDIATESLIVIDEKEDVEKMCSLMIPTADEGADTLGGQIGNKGKVQGRVSVIMASDDFHKFVEGNVLVTTMTTPDFVILMQKSVAIVTDIGGMLSHASIVSRELGKPCVIGTKFATQVLRDGDLVEVDADSGVVRILERTGSSPAVLVDPDKELLIMRDRPSMLSPVYWNQVLQISDEVKEIYGDVLSTEYTTHSNGRMSSVMIKNEWNRVGDFIANKIVDSEEYFKKIVRKTEESKKHIQSFLKEIAEENLENLNFDELTKKVETIRDLFFEYDAASVFAWFVAGDQIKQKIDSILKLSKEDLDILSLPKERTFASQMEQEVLEVAVATSKDIEKEAEKLEKRFYWILFGYDGPTVCDKNYFIEQIQMHRKEMSETRKRLAEIKSTENDIRDKREIIIKRESFTEADERLIDILRRITTWTDERKMLDFQLFYHHNRVLTSIGSMFGASITQMKYLFTHELRGLKEKHKELLIEADKRIQNDFIVISHGDTLRIASDEEKALFKKVIDAQLKHTEVKGNVASAGPQKTYRAVARVLLSPAECSKVKGGEIMVATMTTPDYVPAMRNALGFITDEGGVTCHAAIVGREMNKPCIIGTKVATKILKDGDFVEMDVNNGVVRILERTGDAAIKKSLVWNPQAANSTVIEQIESTDWRQDWSDVYSTIEASLDIDSYFGVFEKVCGTSFSSIMLIFDGDTTVCWSPTNESEELGTHLVQKMLDPVFLKQWVAAYKSHADTLTEFVKLPFDEFLKRLPEYKERYPYLAPHVIGTKIAFNLLPMGHEDVAAELEAARRYTEMFYKNSTHVMNELCAHIAKEKGYSLKSIRALSVDELCEYGQTGVLPEESVLEARSAIKGIYLEKGRQHTLSADDVSDIQKSWQTSVEGDTLKGASAYPGIVRGVCRVVIDYRTASVDDGEVLVATMTDPRFVPFMKKAAAIVTDGGGMLSHAAIVARELKVPCVVGTKLATQVLHDGDLVEVDADSGVVRILEKK